MVGFFRHSDLHPPPVLHIHTHTHAPQQCLSSPPHSQRQTLSNSQLKFSENMCWGWGRTMGSSRFMGEEVKQPHLAGYIGALPNISELAVQAHAGTPGCRLLHCSEQPIPLLGTSNCSHFPPGSL